MKPSKEYVVIAVYMAMTTLLFLWEPLFTWPANTLLIGEDIAVQFVPWLSFLFDSIRRYGALPLWNPYLFSGVPFAANPQVMMFYPFTYLGLLMPILRAMALTLAIHIWLAGMGMYGWLRSLGSTHAGAFLAGVAFAFTGTFSLRLGVGQYGVALQLAWWPLSFWALKTAFDHRSWRWAILSGTPLALGLLSGNVSMIPLLYLALGAYTLFEMIVVFQGVRHWSRPACVLGLAAVAVVTSFALAAVQLVPLLTYSQLSTRSATSSLDFSSRFSMPISHLITLVIPNFFGEVIRIGNWSVEGHQEITYYVGLLIFLVATVGVRLERNRRVVFFLILAAAAAMLQLGTDGVLFTFLYRFVPGIALTRGPGRAGLIYTFAIITAAGLVWGELERASQDAAKRLLGLFSRSLVWGISILAIGATLLTFTFYAAFKNSGVAWTWHLGNALTQFIVLFWAAMALFAAWRNRAISQQTISILAVLMVTLDLWSYGLKGIRPGVDPLAPVWPAIASFMQDEPDYRVALEEGFDIDQHNGALAYRIRGQYGYDPLVLAHYQAFLDSAPDYLDRVYDLLNIKYIVTRQPIEFQEAAFKLDLDTQDLKIYRRPAPLPRAFIVHDARIMPDDEQALAALHGDDWVISRTITLPAAPPCSLELESLPSEETAQVIGESPNHLELATHSAHSGLLVLSEVNYPGWQASIDGQAAQVLTADTVLRAVCLPAGAHTVRFDFWPRELIVGGVVSILAVCVVIGAAAQGWISSRRRSRSRG